MTAASTGLWFALICGAIAVVYGIVTSRTILALPAGNARMQEIAAAIRQEVTRGFSMDVESAITAAARALGFQRLAAGSRDAMLRCVQTLVAEGALKRSGDKLQTSG